ncbi:MAG: hypothetical protein E6G29_06415, partial [Actinobacteria bacterium]
HHALVDGVAAVDVGTVILDPTPEGIELGPPPDDPAERAGAPLEQLANRAAAQLHLPRRAARQAVSRALSLDLRDATKRVRGAGDVIRELARGRPQAPATRLNATIGSDRLFALARARLDDVKAVRRATGATVNDVLLAGVALMISDYLGPGGRARGARQPDLDRVRRPSAARRSARAPGRDLRRDDGDQGLGAGAGGGVDRGRDGPRPAARLVARRGRDEWAAALQPRRIERARPAADLLPDRCSGPRGLPRRASQPAQPGAVGGDPQLRRRGLLRAAGRPGRAPGRG